MQPRKTTMTKALPFVAAGAAAGVGVYLLYRWLRPVKPFIAPQVEENLPLAKNLKTIPDAQGNYDIDGVSFDTEGVIVSSDDNKDARPSLVNPS